MKHVALWSGVGSLARLAFFQVSLSSVSQVSSFCRFPSFTFAQVSLSSNRPPSTDPRLQIAA